jgi:integrase
LLWCEQTRRCSNAETREVVLPVPPLVIAEYIRYLIDRPRRAADERRVLASGAVVTRKRREGPAHTLTVARHLTSIRKVHRLRGLEDPTRTVLVAQVWQGIKNERGTRPKFQKKEVDRHKLLHAVRAIADEHRRAEQRARALLRRERGNGAARAKRAAQLLRLRGHALLLLGWSGALRRSEIAQIDLAHLRFEGPGLEITIPKSKTTQEGGVESVRIAYARDPAFCAVRALRAWLRAADLSAGALFRRIDRHGNVLDRIHPGVVNRVVKASARASGLDAALFGAHSLRSGWITAAAKRKTHTEQELMAHSRHLSIPVFRGYVRNALKWDDHPTLGLL